MAVHTATGGKADWSADGTTYVNVPEVRVWELNIGGDTKEYASSSTGGGKRRLPGAEDFDGSVSVYVDNTNRIDGTLNIKRGVSGYWKLWEDETNFYIAPSYIEGVSTGGDIEGNEIVEADIDFSRNGALIYPQ